MSLLIINLITHLLILPPKECYIPGEVAILKSESRIVLINGTPLLPLRVYHNKAIFVLPMGLFDSDILIIEPRKNEFLKVKKCAVEFPVERLTLPPDKVFLSPEDLERVLREKAEMDSIWVRVNPTIYFNGNFILPITGIVKKNFGLRRIINGEERSPHTGIDIKAPAGTQVIAPQDGRVIYVKNTFFGGNSLIIDHGLGIYTMYFHLKEIRVKEGEMLRKGEVIGTVGMTGRATGPHLHWGIRIFGKRINPLSIIKIDFSKYDNYSTFY